MKRACCAILALSLAATAATPACSDGVKFRLVPDAAKGGRKLIFGVPVDPNDWPALVTAVVGMEYINGRQVPVRCSGALVGPGVLLTAAHCLDPGSGSTLHGDIFLSFEGHPDVKLDCAVPQVYLASTEPPPRVSQDFALCRFSAPAGVSLPPAEVVDAEHGLRPSDAVLLTGFGCRSMDFFQGIWTPVPEEGPNVLTIADTRVTSMPSSGGSFYDGFISIRSDVTDQARQPSLCPGDSGGPLLTGASVGAQKVPRRIRGVNSWVRGCAHDSSCLRSGVASLVGQDFAMFASAWVKSHPGTHICGVKGYWNAGLCRP